MVRQKRTKNDESLVLVKMKPGWSGVDLKSICKSKIAVKLQPQSVHTVIRLKTSDLRLDY